MRGAPQTRAQPQTRSELLRPRRAHRPIHTEVGKARQWWTAAQSRRCRENILPWRVARYGVPRCAFNIDVYVAVPAILGPRRRAQDIPRRSHRGILGQTSLAMCIAWSTSCRSHCNPLPMFCGAVRSRRGPDRPEDPKLFQGRNRKNLEATACALRRALVPSTTRQGRLSTAEATGTTIAEFVGPYHAKDQPRRLVRRRRSWRRYSREHSAHTHIAAGSALPVRREKMGPLRCPGLRQASGRKSGPPAPPAGLQGTTRMETPSD